MDSIYEKIKKTPSKIKKLTDADLREQLELSEKLKKDWLIEFENSKRSNPRISRKDWKIKMKFDAHIKAFERREDIFGMELLKRQNKFSFDQIKKLIQPSVKGERFLYTDIYKMEMVTFSFDDWQQGHEELDIHHHFKLKEYKNGIVVYYLPEVEYHKIRARQKIISENMVSYFLDNLIKDFERGYANSRDRLGLINLEIEKTEKYLTDRQYSGMIPFPNEINSETKTNITLLGTQNPNPGEAPNALPNYNDWVNKWGRDFSFEIKANAANNMFILVPEAVKVLFEYLDYLKTRLNENDSKSTLNEFKESELSPQIEKRTNQKELKVLVKFDDLFTDKEVIKKILDVALQVEIIDTSGKWKWGIRGKKDWIVQFWAAISEERWGLTNVYESPVLPCKALAYHFRTSIGKTMIYQYYEGAKTGNIYTKVIRILNRISGN